MRTRSTFMLLSCSFVACGEDGAADTADTTDTAEVADTTDTAVDTEPDRDTLIRPEAETTEVVEPLEVPEGVWTWFDQSDSACSDGSETGFAVNRGTSDDVLVMLMGGGACWDFNTCFLFNAAARGPFKKTQFDKVVDEITIGVLNRDDADNPYRTWTQIMVPYCTGDLHAGDRVMTYTAGGVSNTWHHAGAKNVALLLPRIAATFPRPDRLVVAGISAGGFGAALQYGAFRAAFGATTTQLVDDSGPFLVGNGIPADHRAAWYANWRLGQVVDPICGQDCKGDLSLLYGKLAAAHPNDRMALISSKRDSVIAGYFLLTPELFELELTKLAAQIAPLATWRMFVLDGDDHTTVGDPGAAQSGGTDLGAWLSLMLDPASSWQTVLP